MKRLILALLLCTLSTCFAENPVLKPGDSLYEKIRQDVIDEYEDDEEEVFASLDKFIDDMVVRRAANEEILAQAAEGEAPDEKDDEQREPSI